MSQVSLLQSDKATASLGPTRPFTADHIKWLDYFDFPDIIFDISGPVMCSHTAPTISGATSVTASQATRVTVTLAKVGTFLRSPIKYIWVIPYRYYEGRSGDQISRIKFITAGQLDTGTTPNLDVKKHQ